MNINLNILKATIFAICMVASFSIYAKGKVVVPYYQNGKYGFCDTLGKQIIMMDYDKIQNMMYYYNPVLKEHTCLFAFEKDNKLYIVNQDNKLMLPDVYDSAFLNHIYPDRFIIQKDGKQGIYYNNKELIPCQYDYIRPTANNSFIVKKNKLSGLINESGQLVIPVEYQRIKFIADDNVHITWEAEGLLTEEEFFDKKVNYLIKYGYPDSSAKDKYANVNPFESSNILSYDTKISTKYAVEVTTIGSSWSSRTKVPKKPAKLLELEALYDKVTQNDLTGNLFYIEKDGLTGIYDTAKNKIFLAVQYEQLSLAKQDSRAGSMLFYAGQKDKYGIIDELNNVRVPMEYSQFVADEHADNIFYMEKDNKIGVFIDETIYPVIPAKYDYIVAAKSIRVSDRWSFQLFITGDREHIKFVGENGVEYFKQ